nr:MAG TPA: hypothetical protein [Crassvirales sp.]
MFIRMFPNGAPPKSLLCCHYTIGQYVDLNLRSTRGMVSSITIKPGSIRAVVFAR